MIPICSYWQIAFLKLRIANGYTSRTRNTNSFIDRFTHVNSNDDAIHCFHHSAHRNVNEQHISSILLLTTSLFCLI